MKTRVLTNQEELNEILESYFLTHRNWHGYINLYQVLKYIEDAYNIESNHRRTKSSKH
jgi:hypothetical protein